VTSTGKDLGPARVYAAAMLEVAKPLRQAEVVLTELSELKAGLDESEELSGFFSSPTVDAGARERVIEKLFRGKLSDVVVDSMQVMNRKGRLHLLGDVAEAYRLVHEELQGHIDVDVRSAVGLADSLRTELRAWAKSYTGKEPELIERIEPSLLGGLIVQIDDEKFDVSLATRLGLLEERLLERSSQEIHTGKTYLEAVI
jgi:F-type H+-transporting ATPase subunit delta